MTETKLTEPQQKIISLIKESPTINAKQMSVTLSVSQRTVERDLSALKEMEILKRGGKDNDGVAISLRNSKLKASLLFGFSLLEIKVRERFNLSANCSWVSPVDSLNSLTFRLTYF